MAADTGEVGVTMQWRDDELLPDDIRNMLCGPGAPFELVEEDVLGEKLRVFAQRPRNMREVLVDAAEKHGESPYLVFGDETVTYQDLPGRVASYAAVLAEEYGVGKGDRVAIASANTVEYALTIWACIVMGAVVTGLNGWWTGPELAYGVELTQPKVLIGDEPRVERITEAGAQIAAPILRWEELAAKVAARGEAALPDTPIEEDDPFIILFTSGTTGRSKGATLSHRNIIHFALSSGLRGATSAMLANTGSTASPMAAASLCAGPFFHISGIAPIMMGGPFYGTSIVFTPPGRWDETTHLELTAKHRIATWTGVPTMYWRLLEHPDFDSYDLTCVAAISSGGAPFPPELIRLLQERFPGVGVSQGYGASETMGAGTLSFGPLMEHHPDAVGRATPAIDIQIRDEDGNVLGAGEVGEICIRSAVVFLGYWDNPAATAEAFWPGRWYRTGDFGRIDDDVLFVESRMRDMILRGAENIYPIEIEHRLVEHPDIADAGVIGVDHRELGQEVKAFVVLAPGTELSESEIQEWVAQSLARHKVPAYIEYRDSLPYTATGKLIKHELETENAASTQRLVMSDRELVRYHSFIDDSARWEGFKFRDDDIIISTPAKCGTTWLQTICALLIFQTPTFDRSLDLISPWLDMMTRPLDEVVANLEAQLHRRFIKTHTPLDGLPFDERVTYICVGRDPRDVALSWDHHVSNIDLDRLVAEREAAVGLDDLAELPPDDTIEPLDAAIDRFWYWVDSPLPMSLASTLHLLSSFWPVRDLPNIVMMHYSDLQADLEGQMRALADRLGIVVPSERWADLVDAATFDAMRARANELVPGKTSEIWHDNQQFFHEGTSGQWRALLDEDDLVRYANRVAQLATPELSTWVHQGPIVR